MSGSRSLSQAPAVNAVDDPIALVPFAEAHLPGAVRLSQAAGWPHRVEDWAFTAALSHGVVALAGEAVVGTGFCSDFGTQAAINMIIVDERLRGRGLGRRIMQAVIDRAAGRPMLLSATEEGRPLYEKLGFVATGTIAQMQGVVARIPATHPITWREATEADLDRLVAWDQDAFGAARPMLYANLLAAGSIFLADDGFAAVRDFGRGRLAGPVVARDADTARALIAACAEPGRFLRVDTMPDTGLMPFLTEAGLAHVGGVTTMRCGSPRGPARTHHTFALASQAIG
ncbi:GNAT family N-acetyltransferase [Lichenihabitans sp. Uapishka_5]|uniref:GNAT family N-acetyltransferase n=1 Tax=Lichenihabitans sp. Uapishka_5 TaxID=3037302 RepID=UPI0029E7D16A|nr:GNAT family N-acetyltransferase [Lichenihabitans sp. Uapishka_5]MDX7950541.1 GNAT family N-acetyltransferase [Lichenihabitans sp. Uapishka_5]